MLSPGVRLGPYQIVRRLGAGGMGEVYEAADRRLDRVVAVKVVPRDTASEPNLKIRLQREARAISALNHPHICALYDVGEADIEGEPTDYLVMEYCEGETLAKRLARGALPLGIALEYGAQLAEALGKAHRAGILHCDIKPGNIVVTREGVKVLDFGLSRRQACSLTSPDADTASGATTGERVIAGTPQYLAPEVLRGGEPDERSDVYALGLVLFEMIEGRTPRGAVTFAPAVPVGVAHLVEGCLHEDPEQRRQSASDLAQDLRWLATQHLDARASSRARKLATWSGWVAAASVAIALGLVATRSRSTAPVTRRLTEVPIPAEICVGGPGGVAVSPSGRWVVFASQNQGPIMATRLDREGTTPLPGTEGGKVPFFSPDGQWIGFWSAGFWKKVPTAGGDVETICPAQFGRASWGPDGVIVFSTRDGLMMVDASGGTPSLLTRVAPGEFHLTPHFLPDGKHVLYAAMRFSRGNEALIAAVNLKSGRVTPLLKGGQQPHYSSTGHLLFLRTATAEVRSGTLFSVEFDPARLRVRGEPKVRAPGLQAYPVAGVAYWDVAPDGAIVYVPHESAFNQRELVWFDRSGRMTQADGSVRYWETVTLSPDGGRIAASDYRNVWIRDVSREEWLKIDAGGVYNTTPVWSPDGKRVVFSSNPGGQYSLFVANADGSGAPSRVMANAVGAAYPSSWSPDGRTILFEGDTADLQWQSWTLDVASGRSSTLRTGGRWTGHPSISPDGEWIVWESQEPESRVYAAPFPSLSPRVLVGEGAPCTLQVAWCAAAPRWTRDGKQIIYKSGDNIMSVDVDITSGVLHASEPETLFQSDYEVEVAPEGRRFIAPHWVKRPQWNRLNVLTGWWADS